MGALYNQMIIYTLLKPAYGLRARLRHGYTMRRGAVLRLALAARRSDAVVVFVYGVQLHF